MKTTKILAILALTGILFSSCSKERGFGSIESEIRSVSNFTKIDIRNAAEVDIYTGDSYLVEVSDYENLLDYMHLYVEDETLVIRNKPSNVILRNSKARVIITMPEELKNIEISGSGDVWVADRMNTLKNVRISGSGSFESAAANHGYLDLSISGSGSIRMSGTATNLRTSISGSGDINLGSLEAQTAECTISGSGNTTVNVSQELNVKITGSGSVRYYGNPAVNANITGSGRLKRL